MKAGQIEKLKMSLMTVGMTRKEIMLLIIKELKNGKGN